MGATTSQDIDIEQLAWAVAQDGPAAHEHELAQLVRAVREAGVALVATDVLADRGASPIARQRAMAHVVAGLTQAATSDGRPLRSAA